VRGEAEEEAEAVERGEGGAVDERHHDHLVDELPPRRGAARVVAVRGVGGIAIVGIAIVGIAIVA
jgi:hypothetical protein